MPGAPPGAPMTGFSDSLCNMLFLYCYLCVCVHFYRSVFDLSVLLCLLLLCKYRVQALPVPGAPVREVNT